MCSIYWVAMSIGLKNSNGSALFDPDVHTWDTELKSKDWKPKMSSFADEIVRNWAACSWEHKGIAICPRNKPGKLTNQHNG